MASATLDFGHGGKDPGASGQGLVEKDITLKVGLEVGKILERHNVKVVYTRKIDKFIDLTPRADIANKANTDIFVSIHTNAFNQASAKGIETYSHPSSAKGATLAKDVHNAVLATKNYTVNRGLKTANFAVLRKTKMPAALIEMAFITNAQDAKLLRTKQSEFALAIAKGILKNLNVKYVGKKPIATTTGTYIVQEGDTLSQIASRHNTTVDKLVRDNNIPNANLIHPGQKLNVGGSVKSIDQMAREVIKGLHGNGHENRRKSLGVDNATYQKVRNRVNQLL